MKKIILASHHRMAGGLQDTLEYILPEHIELTAINAYLENTPVEEELAQALGDPQPKDEIVICTDMMGGSVCQACVPWIVKYPQIHLVAGMNLPLVLSLAMQMNAGSISTASLQQAVEEARGQLVYVNEVLQASAAEEEDE